MKVAQLIGLRPGNLLPGMLIPGMLAAWLGVALRAALGPLAETLPDHVTLLAVMSAGGAALSLAAVGLLRRDKLRVLLGRR